MKKQFVGRVIKTAWLIKPKPRLVFQSVTYRRRCPEGWDCACVARPLRPPNDGLWLISPARLTTEKAMMWWTAEVAKHAVMNARTEGWYWEDKVFKRMFR